MHKFYNIKIAYMAVIDRDWVDIIVQILKDTITNKVGLLEFISIHTMVKQVTMVEHIHINRAIMFNLGTMDITDITQQDIMAANIVDFLKDEDKAVHQLAFEAINIIELLEFMVIQ